ncbi:hypothetical protein M0R88_08235 [Halorussus gelatinilyticus]|uniref:Uncharacterized protein n=1 Tax=Halorussus gelatinilyticus TaxID=2937524 RepID=A0A8U0ILQ9_9EURY|nr:hypothetical protein [Halorussus gelatinilyticus]UPW02070.1 hypothetical protein M0R88_08235 [Halorussus gelatinilyticus]
MDVLREAWATNRTNLLRAVAVAGLIAASASLGYDYWTHHGRSGAILAIVGGTLLLTAVVCVPVSLRRRAE